MTDYPDSGSCTFSEETGECEKENKDSEAFVWTENTPVKTEQNNNTSPQNTYSSGNWEESIPVRGSTRSEVEGSPVNGPKKARTEVTRNKSFGTSDFLQRYGGVRELPPLTQRPAAPIIQVPPYHNRSRMGEVEKTEVQQLSPHTYRTRKTLLLTELNDKVKNSPENGDNHIDEHVHEAISSRRNDSR